MFASEVRRSVIAANPDRSFGDISRLIGTEVSINLNILKIIITFLDFMMYFLKRLLDLLTTLNYSTIMAIFSNKISCYIMLQNHRLSEMWFHPKPQNCFVFYNHNPHVQ